MEQSNTLLEAVKAWVEEYPELGELDLHIDQVDDDAPSYSVGTSGLILLSESVLGIQTWQYNAVLQSREYTADDLSRLNAAAFTEQFIFWTNDRNDGDVLPVLPSGMVPESISADNGMLLDLDEDGDRGLYQIQIHLVFTKE